MNRKDLDLETPEFVFAFLNGGVSRRLALLQHTNFFGGGGGGLFFYFFYLCYLNAYICIVERKRFRELVERG